ncbi:hypothetical protein VNO77_17318 [Canavalia gladiata]|uniref:Uncharacterized protein n=1 Tax=Canavalia gladiata TaxID=3824 RepID=A0AAN9QJ94_CANGL
MILSFPLTLSVSLPKLFSFFTKKISFHSLHPTYLPWRVLIFIKGRGTVARLFCSRDMVMKSLWFVTCVSFFELL